MTKILIVDDDENVTDILEEHLGSAGFEVAALNDSRRAVQTATLFRPDLFIFDMVMPQPDGYRLTGLMRTIPVFQRTPVMLITALGYSNSNPASFGANDFLTKPFDMDEIIPKIQGLLGNTIPL